MKYLLSCPGCGTKTPVATGQAGQMVQCPCGAKFEIPPIRQLRDLEPAEDEPLPPLWTKKHGLLFLGSLLAVCSAGFAAVIWLNIPSQFIPPTIHVDQSAVEKEVAELSPAEAFRRVSMVQPQLRSAELVERRLQSKEVPAFLQISVQPLLEFEAHGPSPLAPKQLGVIQQETSKYTSQIIGDATVRQTLRYWLWVAGAVFVGGILIACVALLVRTGKPSSSRRRTRQVA